MMKKNDIMIIFATVGVILWIVAFAIDVQGHKEAGISKFTYAYEMDGKYYWKNRGNYPEGDPEKEITEDQFRTFMAYRNTSKGPLFVGIFLWMGAGGYFIISKIIYQAKLSEKRRP